ncbi:MAG: DMT family transporter [Firmicutes bacterium]|nr:DMT family transporter [Bacillota bacterium]
MKTLTKGNVYLILAAIVWGMGLVSQQTGMDYLGPLSFTAVRCALGGISMLPLLWVFKGDDTDNKQTIKASFICALILTSLILLQQYGLLFTSVGKAGFITALYILLTPISGVLFLNKPAAKKTWLAVAVALVGMYFLCLTDGIDGINIGDIIMIGAAIIATMHIHVVDHFVTKVNPVRLCCFQFIFVGLICIIPALLFEGDVLTIENIKLSAVPILYAGIASCAMGYTFQTIGQKYTEPNTASLLLSMETVFALLAGWLILGEVLKSQEYIGCILMFIAIILAQLPEKKERTEVK